LLQLVVVLVVLLLVVVGNPHSISLGEGSGGIGAGGLPETVAQLGGLEPRVSGRGFASMVVSIVSEEKNWGFGGRGEELGLGWTLWWLQ